jgi:hypothetical protein
MPESCGSLGAKQKAAEERSVSSHYPVPQLNDPNEWTALGETDYRRMPIDFLQDEQSRSASRELTSVGGHDLHRIAGLLAQRGSHGRAGTFLEGDDLESLLAVMPPDPGSSSPSEVSPTIPNEQVLLRRGCARRHFSSVLPIGLTLLGIAETAAHHPYRPDTVKMSFRMHEESRRLWHSLGDTRFLACGLGMTPSLCRFP